MSVLRERLTDYILVRRAVGFKLTGASYLLDHFVGFMEREGATTVTTQLAVTWATQTTGSVSWGAARLDVVRAFARYLQVLDPDTEVPPTDFLPRSNRRARPYIYDGDEVSALMAAAQALRGRIGRYTYATLIGLLAATGMRTGEAIRLDRGDFDIEQAVLTVRGSKFGKSREVALHATTVAALLAYSRRRDELIPRTSSPCFFVSQAGTQLIATVVHKTFRHLVRCARLQRVSARCRPRLCDFRHSFAVQTLLDWYRDDLDVAARLPLLSTYLGHVNPISTYWYLTATPELLALASQRLQRASEGGGHS